MKQIILSIPIAMMLFCLIGCQRPSMRKTLEQMMETTIALPDELVCLRAGEVVLLLSSRKEKYQDTFHYVKGNRFPFPVYLD